MGSLQNIYINRMLSYLSQEGRRIVTTAQATKKVGDQTFNQADAFGYVVYYNGTAEERGYANTSPKSKKPHHGWDAAGIHEGTGREWLEEFISTYKAPKSGFTLLIVNAAFYTGIQETKWKYRVISQTYGELDSIAAKFKGATVTTTL